MDVPTGQGYRSLHARFGTYSSRCKRAGTGGRVRGGTEERRWPDVIGNECSEAASFRLRQGDPWWWSELFWSGKRSRSRRRGRRGHRRRDNLTRVRPEKRKAKKERRRRRRRRSSSSSMGKEREEKRTVRGKITDSPRTEADPRFLIGHGVDDRQLIAQPRW